ncbi:sensor histidine kinase [Spirillospora sp. CA-255316]
MTALAGVAMAAEDVLMPEVFSSEKNMSTVWIPPAAPFAAYSAVLYSRRQWPAWLPIILLMVVATAPWAPSPQRIGPGLVLVAGPALLGLYVAARRRLDQALIERAERAEREQHLLAEQARADERARLAADMHDVVTDRVSLMVLQAGAMRTSAPDEQMRTAAENLRATGCQALEELRHLLAFLRDPAGDATGDIPPIQEPLPDLSALVAASESVGVPVHLTVSGRDKAVSPAVGRTVYRVVQEALTNVRKHAPGARVEVLVRCAAGGVDVSVRNTPAAGAPDQAWAGQGRGTGLLGLRRRVDVLGGTLQAGPSADGSFHLEARLPASVLAAGALEPAP